MCSLVGLAAVNGAEQEGVAPIRLVPDLPADVKLKGDSTVSRWVCAGSDIEAVFETDLTTREFYLLVQNFIQGGALLHRESSEPTADKDMLRVYVEIRPKLLDCGNPRMERDLQRAVQVDEYPVISYWFTGVRGEVRRVSAAGDGLFEMEISGVMVLANHPREVTHTARVRILNLDELEVSGRLPLKMTDFGIEPPKALLGLVRAHDDFEVFYRFVIRPQPDALPPPPPPARSITGH